MNLPDFHTAYDGVEWRVVPEGVDIAGSGVERTTGQPVTVGRVWQAYGDAINRVAVAYRVPCELIVATVCTETGGDASAVRLEPGYRSDELTPNKVSPGLMQTLISTAREAMQATVDRRWLLDPGNSLAAGTAYIAGQARQTELDPPLVAAAYNAGRVARETASQNRWRLRCYPMGTGAHVDRFVRFYNDAVAVLRAAIPAPRLSMSARLTSGSAQRPTAAPRPRPGTAGSAPAIRFGEHAQPDAVSEYTRSVLTDVLTAADLDGAVVSSTARTPADQARIMFANCERYGTDAQRELYGKAGDAVIEVYAQGKRDGIGKDRIVQDMQDKIRELGPASVSRHTADPRVLNVLDVAPSSIRDRAAFERAVTKDRRVSLFLLPPKDPGYHLEVPQPRT